MNKRSFIFLIAAIISCFAAKAQPVKVSAKVTTQQILIGEPFQLTLQVQLPANGNVQWFQTDTFPHFEILHRSAIDTQRNGNTQTLVQNLQVTSWDSGRWNLPSFSLPRSNKTLPLPITVSFSPMDPQQPYHDVKDVQEVQRPGADTWYWYLIGAALLLLFLFMLFPGRKKEKAAPPPSPEGAYRDAMKQLDQLQKKSDSEANVLFFTELVVVLRQYLQRRKGYQSPSKTTSDIRAQLANWNINEEKAAKLLEALRLSDGVKFARFEASASERKDALKAIRESIDAMEKEDVKTQKN